MISAWRLGAIYNDKGRTRKEGLSNSKADGWSGVEGKCGRPQNFQIKENVLKKC